MLVGDFYHLNISVSYNNITCISDKSNNESQKKKPSIEISIEILPAAFHLNV